MNEVITIGVDLAKNVFQVHGVDAEGTVIVVRQLRRSQVLPFFRKLPLPGRDGSVRHLASLGAAIDRARP